MKLNVYRLSLVPLCLSLVAPLGCGAQPQKKLKLAFVVNNAAAFWTSARAGTAEAIKELNDTVSVDFKIPADATPASQQQIINDLVARREDGIAVSPIDPGSQTDFLNGVASKTLLICHDSDAPASKRAFYIGTDNVAAGVEAGKLIKEALPNGGKIMVFVGKRDAQNAIERFEGITNELKGSKIEIIDVRTDDADTVRAQNNASDTLVKYPNVAAMIGLYSYNGPAIMNAVKSAGKVGQVKIICFDDDPDTLSGVADGSIYGTVVQQPFEFGKEAILKMTAYLRGDKTVFAAGKQIIPTLSIKKDNVGALQAKLKVILGK